MDVELAKVVYIDDTLGGLFTCTSEKAALYSLKSLAEDRYTVTIAQIKRLLPK